MKSETRRSLLILVRRYQGHRKSRHRTRANKAANEVIDLLTPRIESLVRTYHHPDPGLLGDDDLRQIARLGVLEAMGSFDFARSDNFEARAYVIAQNRIRNRLRIHRPVHFSDDDYRKRNKSPRPTPPHTVSPQVIAHEDQTESEVWDEIHHAHTDHHAQSPEDIYMKKEIEISVAEALALLSDKERAFLEEVLQTDTPIPESDPTIQKLRNHIAATFTLDMDSLFDEDEDSGPDYLN